jgi:hypothetical protein
MTDLLQKAFSEAAKLSPEQQDSIASFMLAELEAERQWSEAFSKDPERLAKLSQEAVLEDERGETEDLDPSRL